MTTTTDLRGPSGTGATSGSARRWRGGSIFSGIGGFERGAELADITVDWLWQIEINPYRRSVLSRRCPAATQVDDVRRDDLRTILEPVDIIVGGFPCKDVSDASRGRGGGIEGEHSGLWFRMLDIVEQHQPRLVIVENVDGAAWRRYLPVVRSGLWGLGYSSLPLRVCANQVGAPHRGARVFTVAAPHVQGKPTGPFDVEVAELRELAEAYAAHWRNPAPWHLGVVDGVPHGMDRVRAGGDSIVPQAAALAWHIGAQVLA